MKKLHILALAIAFAATALNAKTLDQARIYINPGHGGWGPNDRPCATIPYPNLPSTGRPDTCGFYESNTNLWKCLKMGATLEKMGAKKSNIMFSRVKNGPFPDVPNSDMGEFNRPLTEICEEVEANNMDYFISVHSNSAGEGVIANYPLILFRGKDVGDNYAKGSYNMAQTLWPIIFSNDIDPKTYYSPTSPNIRGDITFYGGESSRTDPNSGKTYTGYLGVLKHGTPGYLCEGYFHSYQPARHRALNQDYCGQEGVRYARAIAEYFGNNGESTGYIMGTVKDKNERFTHSLYNYKSGSNDQWKPLNGTVVNLYKGGSKVASYTVDNNYNGVFVFENLQPGEYTLDCSLAGYKPLAAEYKKPITVKANETSYPMIFLENENYTPSEFSSENYPDPSQPAGITVPERIDMKKEYQRQYNDIKGTVTRMVTRGDNTVVLSHETDGTPHLYLINNKVKVITTMSTIGIIQKDTQNAGFYSTLSDIAFTADGKLIGCNRIRCQFSSEQVDAGYKRGTVTIYKWDDLYAKPKAWVSTQSSANYYRADMGHTIAVSGSSDDCKIILSGMTSGNSKSIRWVVLDVVNNEISSTMFTEETVSASSNFTLSKLGEDFKVTVSPRANDQFIVDGANTTPFEFKLPSSQGTDSPVVGRMAASNINKNANGATYFKYAKRALMVAPTTDGNGKSIGVKLFDINEGLNNAQLIETTNTNISSTANANNSFAAAIVDQDYINIYLGQNRRITKVTNAPNVAIMATNLDFIEQVDKHTFTFDANDDPIDAEILFYELDGKFSHKVKMPDAKKGHNEFTIPKDQLPLYGLTWEIHLVGKPIHSMTLYKDSNHAGNGIIVDNSTESNYFGNYYVSERKDANNIWMYCFDTNGNQTFGAQKAEMGSTSRLAINDKGTVFVSDWSDSKSGIWLFDPANPGTTCPNFFKGSRNGNGIITNNGVTVGCSSSGVAIYGEGENAKLYMHTEDFGPSGKNDVAIYNIGNSTSWNKAPSKKVKTGHLEINGNCNIVPDETGGFWMSQVRYTPQNTSDVPSLIYVNNSGNIVYNSGTSSNKIMTSSKNGGFQISPDGKTLILNEDTNGEIKLYNIKWTNGTPSLSFKSSFISYDNTFQMAWDYAGNLYTIGKSLKIYSFPKENNECTTAAQKSKVIQGTSSVDENSVEKVKVEIYPNPVTDIMNIDTNQEIESVKIFSATGALMIDTQETSIDVSGLSSGVYLVKVNDNKVIRVIKK